jgi:hypothetical protein
MTAHYIAQAVFQANTNLAKDRFVNTFHFVGSFDGPNSADMMTAAARIADFYVAAPAPLPSASANIPVGAWLSGCMSRTVTVNVYNYDELKPRTPYPFHFQLPDPVGNNLPESVALCASYFSGVNHPRSRGRIYVGPLTTATLGNTPTITSRPTPAVIDTLTQAAKRLAHVADGVADISNVLQDGLFIAGLFGVPGTPSAPSFLQQHVDFPAMTPVNWCQFSAVGGGTQPTKKHPEIPAARIPTFSLVTGGWVDNEWDGQSRRRIQSSARQTWSW